MNLLNKDIIAVCLFAFNSDWIMNGIVKREKSNLYNQYAKDRIKELKKKGFKNIFLLTDNPDFFIDDDITILEYPDDENPSYAHKLIICYLALETYDQVIYLDCDSTVNFDKVNYEDGLTIFQCWQGGQLSRYDDLVNWPGIDMKYFIAIVEYCKRKRYLYKDCPLIEERIFVLKKSENIDKFFKIYGELQTIIEINDMVFGNKPIGRGEGFILSIAALNSGLKLTDNSGTIEITHLPNKPIKKLV